MEIETVRATPQSAVSVSLEARSLKFVQDKPKSSGGQDKGPMASELLLGSLLACQSSTFVKVAAKRKVEAKAISLDGAMHFDAAGDISELHVKWQIVTGASEKDVETVLRLTDKSCTISRILKVPVQFSFEIV